VKEQQEDAARAAVQVEIRRMSRNKDGKKRAKEPKTNKKKKQRQDTKATHDPASGSDNEGETPIVSIVDHSEEQGIWFEAVDVKGGQDWYHWEPMADEFGFLLEPYILGNCNRDPFRACLERCTGASPMIVEAKKATNKKQVEEKNIMECTHDIYNIGNSYDPEANANYCAAGFDLCGVVCAIGGEKLVTKRVERKDYKKGEFFRPSSKNLLSAVFCCINGNKGCTHVVCGPYWRETADR
jgi:hypothetical protein